METFLSLFPSLTLFSAADKELLVGDVPVMSHSLFFVADEEHRVGDVSVAVPVSLALLCWCRRASCWRRSCLSFEELSKLLLSVAGDELCLILSAYLT